MGVIFQRAGDDCGKQALFNPELGELDGKTDAPCHGFQRRHHVVGTGKTHGMSQTGELVFLDHRLCRAIELQNRRQENRIQRTMVQFRIEAANEWLRL